MPKDDDLTPQAEEWRNEAEKAEAQVELDEAIRRFALAQSKAKVKTLHFLSTVRPEGIVISKLEPGPPEAVYAIVDRSTGALTKPTK